MILFLLVLFSARQDWLALFGLMRLDGIQGNDGLLRHPGQ